MNKSGLLDITGGFGEKNVQGEDQQKLDVVADIRFTQCIEKWRNDLCSSIGRRAGDHSFKSKLSAMLLPLTLLMEAPILM